MNSLTESWLLQSAVIFLVIGCFTGLWVGALLVFRPQYFQRINALLDRWISTRHFDRTLDSNINVDPWLYQYRSIMGALMLAGAIYMLYYFTVGLDRDVAITGLAYFFHYPPSLVAGLLDALVLSAISGALCVIFVALFILFRPSLLRDFEQHANQWLSLRKALRPMEEVRGNLDDFVLRYARSVGIWMILGALFALVSLLIWLSRQA